MTGEGKKYDIALSFLLEDKKLAGTIHDRLSERTNVLAYFNRQEELAVNCGIEGFTHVFKEDAHLVVVLYRER